MEKYIPRTILTPDKYKERGADQDSLSNSFKDVADFNNKNSINGIAEQVCRETARLFVKKYTQLKGDELIKDEKKKSENYILSYYQGIKNERSNIIEMGSVDIELNECVINAIKNVKTGQYYEADRVISSNCLSQIGLSLEYTECSVIKLAIGNEQYSSSSLEFNLIDGKKFISFLSQLSEETITKSNFLSYLQNVADSLTKQLIWNYDLSKNMSDETLELIVNMKRIIKEYQRLGQGEQVKRLIDCLKNKQERTLREYLVGLRIKNELEAAKLFLQKTN